MIKSKLNWSLHGIRQRLGAVALIASLAAVTLITLVSRASALDEGGSPPELTRTYRGVDGSAFATRAVGNTIVGFSEDATGQRAFVFQGTRSGTTISGQYYSIPRGLSTATGPLTLTFSNGGSTLTRTGGHDVGPESWQAYLPSAFSYPFAREARFQSTSANDLDGAFKGAGGVRAYVRQYNSLVVYVVEHFVTASAPRPLYSSVFITNRAADGKLTGVFYDLPRQTTPLRYGTVQGQAFSSPRRFTQQTYANGVYGSATFRLTMPLTLPASDKRSRTGCCPLRSVLAMRSLKTGS